MINATVITLIADDPTAHGVFDTPTETERTVMCTVRSVGMSESYQARSIGLSPEWVFDLANKADYQNEKRLIYDSVEYNIVRVYVHPQTEHVELTAQRGNTDV